MAVNSLKNKLNWRRHKRLYHGLVIAGVSGLFILLLALVQPFYNINMWVSDQLLPSGTPSPNIVIAGIDDNTLQTYGNLSDWPRSLHAQAINNLSAAGASVIGFDVIFAESSPDDQVLAAAIKNAGNVVLADAGTGSAPSTGEITYSDFLLPVDSLQQAASSLGQVNVIPDPDGKVRRLPLVVQDNNGKTYPTFTLAVLDTLFHMSLPEKYPVENNSLQLFDRNIPIDKSYALRINFGSISETPSYISYGDIISGNFDPSLVKNKIVLIGMTATGEQDIWPIPNSAGEVPGVEIHAAAMDTILRQNYITPVDMITMVWIMLILTSILAFILPRWRTWHWTDIAKATGITGGLLIIYIIASSIAAGKGHILNVLYPVLLLMVIYVANILFMLITEQSEKRFVSQLFGRYVSPQISEEIVSLADAGKLYLGGEEREITVLFADIRNYTKISEHLSPQAVVKMLNTYIAAIVDISMQNEGIINKFAGDNVMVIWNAPQPQPGHALLGIKAALEAQKKVAELQINNPEAFPIQFGIGINTGKALAGNIGSIGRAEYTVIGDTVNLASRICSSTPGGEVWIGPETYGLSKGLHRS